MLGETRGYPAAAKTPPQALDGAVAARLWNVSETLIGVRVDDDASEVRSLSGAANTNAAAA